MPAKDLESNRIAVRKWRAKNREYDNSRMRRWAKDNPEKMRATNAKRRATILRLTPSWYCDVTVKEIYAACPEGMEVDHIQSLNKGGLHSHENLQYLTIEENRQKGNKEHGGLYYE